MGEIVNLRLARKRRTRRAAEEKAEENRRLHGQTGSDKERERTARRKLDTFLAGHKLERPDPDGK